MANLWFRLYSEFADDPKVQMLSEAMQRRLIMLFCSKCKQETLLEHQRAFHWRITMAELAETRALFVELGFIDDAWNLLNWNRRQFISDSSTDRTRRYRERSETSQERHGNATVTVCDALEQIQNRTDTDPEAERTIAPGVPPIAPLPVLGTFPCTGKTKVWPFTQQQVGEWSEAYPGIGLMAELREAKQWLIARPKRAKTYDGMPAFISNWLKKAQNECGGNSNGKGNHANAGRSDQIKRDLTEALTRMGSKETGEDSSALHDGEIRH